MLTFGQKKYTYISFSLSDVPALQTYPSYIPSLQLTLLKLCFFVKIPAICMGNLTLFPFEKVVGENDSLTNLVLLGFLSTLFSLNARCCSEQLSL